MNLGELIDRIEWDTRHAPDVKVHRDELRGRLNDTMERLLSSERWGFMQRHRLMRLKAKVTLTTAQWTANPTISGSANKLAVTFAVPSGWDDDDATLLSGHHASFATWTGAGTGKFIIEESGKSGSDVYIIFDPGLTAAPTASDGSLSIEFLRYLLPLDCAEPYGVMFRTTDDGHLHELALAQETSLMLNEDDSAGTPRWWLTAPNRQQYYRKWDAGYYPHDGIPAPVAPPVLAQTTSGSLSSTGKYEYCYAWEYAGQVSQPSPTATIQMTGSNQTVNITGMDTTDTVVGGRRGRNRIIYRRVLINGEGPWYKIDTQTDPTDATAADDGTFSAGNPLTTIRRRRYSSLGKREWIRFYPVTDTDLEAELRYHARPPWMEALSDEPALPAQYHPLLAHLVVRDYAMSGGAKDLARTHAELAKEYLTAMRNQHLVRSSERYQRHTILRGYRPGYIVQSPSYTSDA